MCVYITLFVCILLGFSSIVIACAINNNDFYRTGQICIQHNGNWKPNLGGYNAPQFQCEISKN